MYSDLRYTSMNIIINKRAHSFVHRNLKRCHDDLRNKFTETAQKNKKKNSRDNAQAPHHYHYLMKYNQCIVWVHLLKFLEHWCDVNLPKSFIVQVCFTLSPSRESCSTGLIQNNKDYTPNCVISWLALFQNLDKQRCALCCKPNPSRDWAYPRPWRLRRRKH